MPPAPAPGSAAKRTGEVVPPAPGPGPAASGEASGEAVLPPGPKRAKGSVVLDLVQSDEDYERAVAAAAAEAALQERRTATVALRDAYNA